MATITLTSMPRAIPAGYLTVNAAAKEAGVGRETIFRWTREGRMKRYRMAGIRETLVKRDELARVLAPRAE